MPPKSDVASRWHGADGCERLPLVLLYMDHNVQVPQASSSHLAARVLSCCALGSCALFITANAEGYPLSPSPSPRCAYQGSKSDLVEKTTISEGNKVLCPRSARPQARSQVNNCFNFTVRVGRHISLPGKSLRSEAVESFC